MLKKTLSWIKSLHFMFGDNANMVTNGPNIYFTKLEEMSTKEAVKYFVSFFSILLFGGTKKYSRINFEFQNIFFVKTFSVLLNKTCAFHQNFFIHIAYIWTSTKLSSKEYFQVAMILSIFHHHINLNCFTFSVRTKWRSAEPAHFWDPGSWCERCGY